MPDSPFKLLEAYGPDEKDIFFGRDAEIYALYNLLQQTRLVLVYGASGTGKTSLIQAGLPKVFKVTDWFRVSVRRRDDINASLREELARSLPEGSTADDLSQSIRQVYERRWIPVYLVFDQFEELFTLGNHDERVLFFQSLQTLLDANLPCKIILSMREEYIGHLYDYEPLVPTLFDKRFRMEPMKDATVTEVVEKICDVNAIQLEKEAPQPDGEKTTAEQIKDQVKEGKQAAYLPYLQIYLYYLYEQALATKRRPVIFDQTGITAVGKLGDVLKKFIESKTADAQQYLLSHGAPADFAQRLLDEFATGDGTKQARRKVELAETLKADETLVEKALLYFSDTAKLLRADENDVERYEPVHDVVAKQIHELRSVEDKDYIRFVLELKSDYERWQSDKTLLQQPALNKVEVYRERLAQKDEFRENWAELVEKSKLHMQAVKRRRRIGNLVLAVITLVAVVAMAWALNEQNKTQAALEQVEMEKAGKEKERQKAESNFLLAKEAEAKALAAQDSIGKVYKNYLTGQRQKFLTEAKAASNEKRYSEALKAYRNALNLTDSPSEKSTIAKDMSYTEKEKNDFEFQRNKDIGLAMKTAGDCKGALFYLELADKSRNDKVVKDAIKACKQN